MTEWRDPEPPVPTPEPGPNPGLRWAPEPKPAAAGEPAAQADQADPRYILPDPPPDSGPSEGDPVEGAVEEGAPVAPDEPESEPVVETGGGPVVEVPEAAAPSAPASPAEPAPSASPAEPAASVPEPPPAAETPAPAVEDEPDTPEPGKPEEVTAPTAPLVGTAPSVWGAQVPDVPGAPGVSDTTPVTPVPPPGFPSGLTTPTAPTDNIFRDAVVAEPTELDPLSAEAEKLAAERAARREAREAALTATAPVALTTPPPVVVHKRTNDKFFGSLGLFLLRLVTAAIFLVRGLNIVADIPAAQTQFATTIIPYPQVMAIVTGVACLLIALSLVLGLLTRVAGLGVLLIAGGALAFVLWGPWSPFVAGQPGFIGEYELLLATVGLLFLLLGGGGWSIDRSFRAGRERDRAERQMAA